MRRGQTQPSIRWVAAATGTLDLGKSSRNCLMPETLLQVRQQYSPLPRSQTGGPKIFETQNVLGFFFVFFWMSEFLFKIRRAATLSPLSCKATITSGWRVTSLHRWGQRSLIPHRGHQCPSGRQSPLLALSGVVSPSQMYIACLGTYYILVLLQVESCFICIFWFQGGEGCRINRFLLNLLPYLLSDWFILISDCF